MSSGAALQSFFFRHQQVQLFVPDRVPSSQILHSPYWAKVWPAALGLCYFLQENLSYIHQKKILEIAAGLGLPSIFAAPHAAQVFCTDIEPAAIDLVQQSVLFNKLSNVDCVVADWNNFRQMEIVDTILLSDVNYEPRAFEQLITAIKFYLQKHCTVILSTPQRLMAKPFVEQLLPFCRKQEEVIVKERKSTTAVSIFVLSSGIG